jgi:diadenosine tetraphosphate (Ap4A) HIT family hydrolase
MSGVSCEFCRLVKKENEATIVFEDHRTMAFMDIRPVNDGHTLVIPKNHYENIYDVPEDEVANIYKVVKKVAGAIKRGVNPDGLSITQHNGRAAMQRVFHLHVHVIPRYAGQRFPRPDELSLANRERLEEVAKKIRKYM